ncbi:MAG: alpha/beta fold hydrolase [Bacteroidetes bacterium]|nr:alpha/beta fold hydrolase [Bacteroidota bacterium]
MKYLSLLTAIFLFFTVTAPAQTQRDTTLRMSDDVMLDAFFMLPTTPAPPGGWPAVLLVHGFGGSKNNNTALARSFAQLGYVATSYSVRGQGASGGLFDFFTSDRIIEDLQAMVDFTKALPDVNPSRVGVMGGSQGGLHAWNAAAYDMGVRAVISIVANGRFRENWLGNDALNWTFAAASLAGNVDFDPAVLDSITRARESGDFSYIRSFLENASTRSRESGITTPTAIIVSYYDGFFDQNAALRQFDAIPAEKRIILYPAGHSLPSDPAQENYVMDVVARWFEYWLRDRTEYASVASPDSAVVFFDAGDGSMRMYGNGEEVYWRSQEPDPRPEDLGTATWYFTDEGLSLTPQLTRSERTINYINLLGSTPSIFLSPPLEEDMIIVPTPATAVLRAGGTGSQYQMNLVLYDVDPATNRRIPLTRCHMQRPRAVEEDLTIPMNSVLHTVKAGHRIQVQVHAGMAVLPNTDNNFGNFVLGPVDNSVNTLVVGDNGSSSITFNVLEPEPVSVGTPTVAGAPVFLGSWPNPLRSAASVAFRIGDASHCRLTVHDSRGRIVAVLHDADLAPGEYSARFDAGDLPAGLYVAVLQAGTHVDRLKLLLVR